MKGGAQNVFTQEQDEISANVCDGLCMCMCVCMFKCMLARPRGVSGQWKAFLLSAAGGSTGLVKAHGFAQPAGKVHFLHFRSLDICVTHQLL